MFFLRTKLRKTNNFFVNLEPIFSFGKYRWKKLSFLFNFWTKSKKGFIKKSNLILLKNDIYNFFYNPEMDKTLSSIHKWIKKSIQSYVGLRLELALPVWGQRTRTNASTQRLLTNSPWKWHFVQKRNRRKFITKVVKNPKSLQKNDKSKKN